MGTMLKGFSGKEFVEKVMLLQEIETGKRHEAIPDLFEICKADDPGDQALFMAENTLRALLLENEEQTLCGLQSENLKIKKIALQVVNQKKYSSAASILLELLSDSAFQGAPGVVFEILAALSAIKPPEALDVFQKNLRHPDSMISSLSIETIGDYGDISSVDELSTMIRESEADDRFDRCDITTANAIESLGKIKNDAAISFLASKIHHRNPSARRLIHETLGKIGSQAVPFIAPYFEQENVDNKIMAANVLGCIGDKKCSDILVSAVDRGAADHPNIMFAIYEALGRIPSMKSLVCLADGLKEKNDLMLLAVISSLNLLLNPGIVSKFRELITAGDEQSRRLVSAIVTAKALAIFESLYEDEKIAGQFIAAISSSNDETIVSAFIKKLEKIGSERARADLENLKTVQHKQSGVSVLAVDDSSSMLMFYRSVVSSMDLTIETAVNGKEALDRLERGETFNLIVTDMNMPIMDGIEFSQKVRANLLMEGIPILMATTESDQSQVELAAKAGVSDFIKKPFTAEMLKEKLFKFIG